MMSVGCLWACMLSCFGCVLLCVTLWTAACQALNMGFSRQEYWSDLPCPVLGDLLDPGIKPTSLRSPAPLGKPQYGVKVPFNIALLLICPLVLLNNKAHALCT